MLLQAQSLSPHSQAADQGASRAVLICRLPIGGGPGSLHGNVGKYPARAPLPADGSTRVHPPLQEGLPDTVHRGLARRLVSKHQRSASASLPADEQCRSDMRVHSAISPACQLIFLLCSILPAFSYQTKQLLGKVTLARRDCPDCYKWPPLQEHTCCCAVQNILVHAQNLDAASVLGCEAAESPHTCGSLLVQPKQRCWDISGLQ